MTETSNSSTRRRRGRRAAAPLWFLFPALAIFGAIVLVPSVIGASYSFTDATSGFGGAFIGLENYQEIFSDPSTLGPLWQTLVMAFGVMVLQNVLGLAIAVALNSRIKSRNFLRVLFFMPFVISPLVAGYLWKYLLAPDGAVNQFLKAIGLGSLAQPWLGQPDLALGSLIIAVVWQFTGSSMVIYLAGLQGVPAEVLEAASLDGAGGWRRFWNIVRPFLYPAIMVNFTLSLISGLRLYDQIVAMTGGGPGGSTDSISTVIYRYAFEFGQFGYGSALALILTVLIIVLSSLQYTGLRKQARA
ncbi:sugar ABC transporter permease [Microbacterium chocolatum]|uniref:carbohydrate ABC transporter permease n=1 Tax=Microbacterium aurantiacum TaxID=162393 RepID=UPI00338F8A42